MAEPFQRFASPQREQVEKYLADLGVSPAQRTLQTV